MGVNIYNSVIGSLSLAQTEILEGSNWIVIIKSELIGSKRGYRGFVCGDETLSSIMALRQLRKISWKELESDGEKSYIECQSFYF